MDTKTATIVTVTAALAASLTFVAPLAYNKFRPAVSSQVITQPGSEKTLRSIAMLEPVTDQDRSAAAALVKKISQEKASVADVFRGPAGFVGVVVNTGENKFIGWMPAARDAL